MTKTTHPKMIKNYFQQSSSTTNGVEQQQRQRRPQQQKSSFNGHVDNLPTEKGQSDERTSEQPESQPRQQQNNNKSSSGRRVAVTKSIKRKIRDILEDQSRYAAAAATTATTPTLITISTLVSSPSPPLPPQTEETTSTSNNNNNSHKKVRTSSSSDVKKLTRINLPMTIRAVNRKTNSSSLVEQSAAENTNPNGQQCILKFSPTTTTETARNRICLGLQPVSLRLPVIATPISQSPVANLKQIEVSLDKK